MLVFTSTFRQMADLSGCSIAETRDSTRRLVAAGLVLLVQHVGDDADAPNVYAMPDIDKDEWLRRQATLAMA